VLPLADARDRFLGAIIVLQKSSRKQFLKLWQCTWVYLPRGDVEGMYACNLSCQLLTRVKSCIVQADTTKNGTRHIGSHYGIDIGLYCIGRETRVGFVTRPLQALKKLAGFPPLRLFFLPGTPAGLSQSTRGDPLEAPHVAGVQSNFQST
jgi:hypothetical protein